MPRDPERRLGEPTLELSNDPSILSGIGALHMTITTCAGERIV